METLCSSCFLPSHPQANKPPSPVPSSSSMTLPSTLPPDPFPPPVPLAPPSRNQYESLILPSHTAWCARYNLPSPNQYPVLPFVSLTCPTLSPRRLRVMADFTAAIFQLSNLHPSTIPNKQSELAVLMAAARLFQDAVPEKPHLKAASHPPLFKPWREPDETKETDSLVRAFRDTHNRLLKSLPSATRAPASRILCAHLRDTIQAQRWRRLSQEGIQDDGAAEAEVTSSGFHALFFVAHALTERGEDVIEDAFLMRLLQCTTGLFVARVLRGQEGGEERVESFENVERCFGSLTGGLCRRSVDRVRAMKMFIRGAVAWAAETHSSEDNSEGLNE